MNVNDKALYLCDRRACNSCSYPRCKHTSDIRHAKNFKVIVQNTTGGSVLIEKENMNASTLQGD